LEVFEAIQKRHSVRAYLPNPVPHEKLARILEAARLAPSASNVQPWHFVVVTDKQKRKELSESRYAGFLAEAPVIIVGCGDAEVSPKWHAIDVTIALENMVLAATGEGLGTCWIGSFEEQKVKQSLNIPAKFRVVALLAVGYEREELDSTGKAIQLIRRRKRLQDIASLDSFGCQFAEEP